MILQLKMNEDQQKYSFIESSMSPIESLPEILIAE